MNTKTLTGEPVKVNGLVMATTTTTTTTTTTMMMMMMMMMMACSFPSGARRGS